MQLQTAHLLPADADPASAAAFAAAVETWRCATRYTWREAQNLVDFLPRNASALSRWGAAAGSDAERAGVAAQELYLRLRA